MNTYNLFADYFQFYLQDETATGDLSDSWTPEAIDRLLALAPGTIGVMTVRNATVPVHIEIGKSKPSDDFSKWDHVTECSIEVPSGKIVIAGCTDYFPDAARIKVEPGSYCARIFYGGLNTISPNALVGQDHYEIFLWPAAPTETKILKLWNRQKIRFQGS